MRYTIDRYPTELIDVVLLDDGRRLTIRPVLPQDAEIVQTFVRTLSDGSRRSRFFRALRELSDDLLNRFINIDYHSHLALLAEVFDADRETMVGEARYVVDGDPSCAEVAVAVADAWQGHGIGGLLLQRLERGAATGGIGMLVGRTLATNLSMQRLARKAGYSVEADPSDSDVLCISKQVGSAALREPGSKQAA
jgi:acetyltransferase